MLKQTMTAWLVVAVVTTTASASAQEISGTRASGWFVGAHMNNTALTIAQPRETTFGGGAALTVGYAFANRFAITLTGAGARVDNPEGDQYTLGHADLMARYGVRSRRHDLIPYLNGGLTTRAAEFTVPAARGGGTTTRSAVTASIGGGLQYFVTRGVAIEGSLRYTFGHLSHGECPETGTEVRTCATSTRLSLGIEWHPGRR